MITCRAHSIESSHFLPLSVGRKRKDSRGKDGAKLREETSVKNRMPDLEENRLKSFIRKILEQT